MKEMLVLCMFCLPLKSIKVTSPYGYRVHPLSGKIEFHNGVDLKARYDTVYAVLNGVTRSVCYGPHLGIAVNLQHGEVATIYGHLSKVFVSAGDSARAGDAIAVSGTTGRVTAAHLHFSIRYQGHYLNPLNFLYELLTTKDHE